MDELQSWVIERYAENISHIAMIVKKASLPVVIALAAVAALTVTAGLITTAYYGSGQSKAQTKSLVAKNAPVKVTAVSKMEDGKAVASGSQAQDIPPSIGSTRSQALLQTGPLTPSDTGPLNEAVVAAKPVMPTLPASAIEESQVANNPESPVPDPVSMSSEVLTPASGSITLLQQPANSQSLPATTMPASLLSDDILPNHLPEARDVALNENSAGDPPNPDAASEGGEDQAPNIPEKVPPVYPNLSSHLNHLVASFEAGEATPEKLADDASLQSGEAVAVTIYLSAHVDAVVQLLVDNGGDPRNMGEDYIEAYVPVPLLAALSERPGVTMVRGGVDPVEKFTGSAVSKP